MRLTTLTDYALRLLMHAAQQLERLTTIAEVAARYDISHAHLMKVTHLLAQAGFLETQRGKGGGLRLARPAAEILLGDVVRCTEGDFTMADCFATGSQCSLSGRCRLAGVLDDALGAFLRELDRKTLADVLPLPASARAPAPLHWRPASLALPHQPSRAPSRSPRTARGAAAARRGATR